jgi:hypothetical protein
MAAPTPTFTALANPPNKPALRFIANVTNANPALVTTTIPHLYASGIIARLYIPQDFGMYQADQLFGAIIVINATQFTIAIDTSTFDVYNNPGNNLARAAMVVPIGEITADFSSAFTNTLPNAIPIVDANIPVPPSFIGYNQLT